MSLQLTQRLRSWFLLGDAHGGGSGDAGSGGPCPLAANPFVHALLDAAVAPRLSAPERALLMQLLLAPGAAGEVRPPRDRSLCRQPLPLRPASAAYAEPDAAAPFAAAALPT